MRPTTESSPARPLQWQGVGRRKHACGGCKKEERLEILVRKEGFAPAVVLLFYKLENCHSTGILQGIFKGIAIRAKVRANVLDSKVR